MNGADYTLIFTVLDLSPTFRIGQLFPVGLPSMRIPPRASRSFNVRLSLPKQRYHAGSYRDIIRTVVTRGAPISLKALELSGIGETSDILESGFARDLLEMPRETEESIDEDGVGFAWWIHDFEILTGNRLD